MATKKVLIIGGGFGGVAAALELAKCPIPNTKTVLVSDKPHFEYHAGLYRVVTGRTPLEVCIQLQDIFTNSDVEVLVDQIVGLDLKKKIAEGFSGSDYAFDYLILALGSETAYFDIPGLKDLSFGFKSITEALKLKRHIHELFEKSKTAPPEEKLNAAQFVVIGGGASGVELAGDLAIYTRSLARKHGLDPSFVTIDLVEAATRLLPAMPEIVSFKVTKRLRELGVNIFVNRSVVKEEVESVFLRDMQLRTKTVIWTAGVEANSLYSKGNSLPLDPKGRVMVDEYLQPKGFPDIFVIGDAAATLFAGMASTAKDQGQLVGRSIASKILNKGLLKYRPKKPTYSVPVGPRWAASVIGWFHMYGRAGWWYRRYLDLKFFRSILPFRKAMLAFREDKTLCESCMICAPEGGEKV